MSHIVLQATLAADLADAGTLAFTYPDGYNESMFAETGHVLVVKNGNTYNDGSKDFTLSFALTAVTLTNCTEATIPAESEVFLQLRLRGSMDKTQEAVPADLLGIVGTAQVVFLNLGAPGTADSDGYVASQDLTTAGAFSVDTDVEGALDAAALNGVADAPTGRNVVAAWTGAAVLTVTGTDMHGNVLVESSASGTSLTGKKAFKTITDITTSANITSLTVGTGDVLGLPVYLPSLANVIGENVDGAKATAGTPVAGVLTEPSATTGDVRGTYDPNAACDGDKNFSLIVVLEDPFNLGSGQYAG